ncbi:SAV_2336 N-terminal domain-related protein [Longispora fulva]|uniref:SAV_2336 N-terminal domain-related protein n=1 Tax=Longispora fulva TaxID=619741 RepID=UPI0018CAC1F2|nr:SAV_2336 N-terminal domain-related protein [Longispora fulva]
MIDQVASTLRDLDVEPTAGRIADALVLAGYTTSAPLGGGAGLTPRPLYPEYAERSGSVSPLGKAPVYVQPEPPFDGLDQQEMEGDAYWLPAGPAAPGSLALSRALRPLRIRRPSVDRRELDEAATARRIAEEGLWEPVVRPRLERWPDLALVVDDAPSMAKWSGFVRQLHELTETLGAFRLLRRWELQRPADGPPTVRSGSRPPIAASGLADPTGRTLFLVVTDGADPHWNVTYPALLRRWGAHSPVAVLSLTPPRLWPRRGLRVVPGKVKLDRPLSPNGRWRGRTADGVRHPDPVPVVELHPRRVRWLAELLAGGADWSPQLLLDPSALPDGPDPVVERPALSAAEAVRRFRATYSPLAYSLLVYLADFPLTARFMAIVQQVALPNSGPLELAEVLDSDLVNASGLLRDDVRDELTAQVHPRERDRIRRRVGLMLDRRIGRSPERLAALVPRVGGTPGLYAIARDRGPVTWLPQSACSIESTVEPQARLEIRLRFGEAPVRSVHLGRLLERDVVSTTESFVAELRAARAGVLRIAGAELLQSTELDGVARVLVRHLESRESPQVVLTTENRHAMSAVYHGRPGLDRQIATELRLRLWRNVRPFDHAYQAVLGVLRGWGLRSTPDFEDALWVVVRGTPAEDWGPGTRLGRAREFAEDVGRRWLARSGGDRLVPLAVQDLPASSGTERQS